MYYQNRNYAYFFTKYYIFRMPHFGFIVLDATRYGWKCLRRTLRTRGRSLLVFWAAMAGRCAGIGAGIKWHIARLVRS